jgi:hypothetical protein
MLILFLWAQRSKKRNEDWSYMVIEAETCLILHTKRAHWTEYKKGCLFQNIRDNIHFRALSKPAILWLNLCQVNYWSLPFIGLKLYRWFVYFKHVLIVEISKLGSLEITFWLFQIHLKVDYWNPLPMSVCFSWGILRHFKTTP